MDIVDRLLSRIKVTPSGCFEWQGCRSSSGYGWITAKGYAKRTHRASYQVFRGPIPPGMSVCHHCDNPCCINPAHLFIGTPKDNMQDCIRKKRANRSRGEAHGRAVLESADIVKMRYDHSTGMSVYKVSQKFGISYRHAQQIITREFWKHIQ